MDHAYIEEHSLIERYLEGRLDPEEEARFEAYFLESGECTEQLELAQAFSQGIKVVAAEEAARIEGIARAGILAKLAYLARRRLLAIAVTAALTAVLTTTFWLGVHSPTDSVAVQPLANTPVLILSTVRGNQEPALLELAGTEWTSLAVDVDDDPRFDGYRITVSGAAGELWRRDGLLPNALETLMVTFPSSFFAAGDYQLRVQGVLPDGQTVEIATYPFKVSAEP